MQQKTFIALFAGLDPSGGAGLSADIETLAYHGVMSLPIATTITVQNQQKFARKIAITGDVIEQQFSLLKNTHPLSAIKLGLLNDAEQIKTIGDLLNEQQHLPIVCDPIITSSSGQTLLDEDALMAFKKHILPRVRLLTPNHQELKTLSDCNNWQEGVKKVVCPWLLLTDGDTNEPHIKHRLFHQQNEVKTFVYQKLPHHYHGSGCTLTSAICCHLAQNIDVVTACQKALDFTDATLRRAYPINTHYHYINRHHTK